MLFKKITIEFSGNEFHATISCMEDEEPFVINDFSEKSGDFKRQKYILSKKEDQTLELIIGSKHNFFNVSSILRTSYNFERYDKCLDAWTNNTVWIRFQSDGDKKVITQFRPEHR